MKLRPLLLVLRLTILVLAGVLILALSMTNTIYFRESDASPINPGRGFYVQFSSDRTEKMKELRENGITLALLAFDMRDFTNSVLSAEKLQELQDALQAAADAGLQVIFRAAYFFGSADYYKDPSGLNLIRTHIMQIAPVLNESEAVLCVQAGFLGPWGEWHSSSLLSKTDEAANVALRNGILRSLLDNVSPALTIDVRRPRFVRDFTNAGFNGSRLGFHNDALLAGGTDMGTYSDPTYPREAELVWTDQFLSHGVNGGEMPQVSAASSAPNALREFRLLHLTYLNARYNKDVLDTWSQDTLEGQNALTYLGDHLGYRLTLSSARLPAKLREGKTMKFNLNLSNTGFAAVSKPCELTLLLQDGTTSYVYPLKTSGLVDLEPGKTVSVAAKITLPESFQSGQVQLGLRIEMAGGAQKGDPNRCIELATDSLRYENCYNYFSSYSFTDGKYKLGGQAAVSLAAPVSRILMIAWARNI